MSSRSQTVIYARRAVAMYRAVPPPGEVSEAGTDGRGEGQEAVERGEDDEGKPANVPSHQWKRFQALRARREKECGVDRERRIAVARNKAMRTVSKELSSLDKAILEEKGVSLTQGRAARRRKRRRERRGGSQDEEGSCEVEEGKNRTADSAVESQWQEVRKYLDPNPQLKGIDQGQYATKSNLEESMEKAIERGEFHEATEMSDRLAQREFATKVATAFDCSQYVKRKKMEQEKRNARKPKLYWRFEHKQRWESKGNM